MIKKMNLPNKLTMLRIALVPLFIFFMALPICVGRQFKFIALFIYILASITDFLDGHIARSRKLITNFGKIADPLADKLLVSSGFVMLSGIGVIPAWITCIILFRDFTISSLRMFAINSGGDVGAVWSGKVKTTFQLIGICLGIFELAMGYSNISMFSFLLADVFNIDSAVNALMTICIVIATITTIWSLIDYFFKYKKYIDVTK